MNDRENMDDYPEEYTEEIEEPGDQPKREKKHYLYRLFNPEGKEQKPIPDGPDGIKKGFIIYKRNLTRLLYINLIMILGNFPLLFGFYALMGGANSVTTAASSEFFPQLHGVMLHSASPVSLALFGVHGGQVSQQVLTPLTYIFLGISLLFIFTFGVINTGTAYLLRGMVRQDHLFFWSDFKGAIKRNFKQGFITGIIDALLLLLLVFDVYFFYINGSMMFYIMIVVISIYLMMRFYVYPLLITFDLSIWKIFKNSMIFSLLGIKRNILAFLLGVLIFGLELFLLTVFFPLGVVFPLFLMFSTCAFFGTYAAWAKIKQVMIDPYVEDNKSKK